MRPDMLILGSEQSLRAAPAFLRRFNARRRALTFQADCTLGGHYSNQPYRCADTFPIICKRCVHRDIAGGVIGVIVSTWNVRALGLFQHDHPCEETGPFANFIAGFNFNYLECGGYIEHQLDAKIPRGQSQRLFRRQVPSPREGSVSSR